jgi:transcriptional regulator with XRE-family HTH domain
MQVSKKLSKKLSKHDSKQISKQISKQVSKPDSKQTTLFGQRMAAIRKSKGLTQSQLAKLLDTTRANIDYYENRAANPTLDFILRAADVLEVSPADLISIPAAAPRHKPGPQPQLLLRLEKLRRLPRRHQKFILDTLDNFLALFSKLTDKSIDKSIDKS